MKKFGLIGHPIAHSLSPALFRAGYGGKYPYDLIEGDDFDESYRIFKEHYDGINVTAPFKEKACAAAELLSEECMLTGAANILTKTPEGIKAHNSDYLGVKAWLEDEASPIFKAAGLSPAVLVAGCGGAGKAAAYAAAMSGMQVVLMNRDMAKAEAIISAAAGSGTEAAGICASRFTTAPVEEFRHWFRQCGIIIYTIPAAIQALKELDAEDFAGPDNRPKIIMEANYRNPSFSPDFVQRITNTCPAVSFTEGRTWLLYQALTGYEIFTGEKPDLAGMRACL